MGQARSTVVPLSAAEWGEFVCTLLDLLTSPSRTSRLPLLSSYRLADGSYQHEMWVAIVAILHFVTTRKNSRYEGLRFVDMMWGEIHVSIEDI